MFCVVYAMWVFPADDEIPIIWIWSYKAAIINARMSSFPGSQSIHIFLTDSESINSSSFGNFIELAHKLLNEKRQQVNITRKAQENLLLKLII